MDVFLVSELPASGDVMGWRTVVSEESVSGLFFRRLTKRPGRGYYGYYCMRRISKTLIS